MSWENSDLGVFQEMNVTGGIYARGLIGYRIMATEAPIPHRISASVFYREVEQFTLEELCLYLLNVASFQMVTGRQQWHVVVCCIAPHDASTLEGVVAAISRQP